MTENNTEEIIEEAEEGMTEEKNLTENDSDAQAEFSEQYKKLPLWKQAIILVLFLGGMTAVIMLINFIVEFGADIIRTMLHQ